MPLRRSHGAFNCRRALSACATALLVLLGPALGMVAASAVEVPDAVRSVGIVETGSTVYGSMRVELDWMVPDGSRTGDTFTVGLPAKVKAPDGFRFPIKDAAGEVVAWGQVHGSAVVFTLTPYAESHDGVSGAAWLEVKWNQKLVTPGTTEEVVFTVEDKTYRDEVVIAPRVLHRPAGKYMTWVANPPAPRGADDHLQWGIQSMVFSPAMVGSTVVLRDIAGPGQAIVCDTLRTSVHTVDATNGSVYERPLPHRLWLDTACTTGDARTSFVVTADLVDRRVVLVGWSTVTDYTLAEYTNAGEVTRGTETKPVSARVTKGAGGGTGGGSTSVCVGDLVWFDANHDGVQGTGEAGIPGVKLTLTGPTGQPVTDVSGAVVGPQTTSPTGTYSFCKLPALPAGAHYTVTIGSTTVATGYLPTLTGSGTPATDSALGVAVSTDLTANRDKDLTLDFGYWRPAPAVDIEKLDAAGHDADAAAKAVELGAVPGATGLVFVVKNTGTEPLVDVAISDTVLAGGTVTGLRCTFPGGSTGVSWSGPLAVGASFTCSGQLSGVLPGTVHHDRAAVSGTGAESGIAVKDADDYFAKVTVAPAVDIEKLDAAGHDADQVAQAVDLSGSKAATGLVFVVRNTGTEPLVDVTVTDTVVSNGSVTGLSCTFPDGSSGRTWTGPFAVGTSFRCTATLAGVVPSATPHEDIASVTGHGQYTATTVTDKDGYFATVTATPGISVVKGDEAGNAADTREDAVRLPDGRTGLVITVRNTGNEPLVHVSVTDRLWRGGVVDSLSCDFSAFGGPATGTTWAGPLPAGGSFSCAAALHDLAAGDRHKDTVKVSGQGAISGTVVSDRDPYFALRPSPRAPLPRTGAQLDGALPTAALLVGGGLGLVVAASRRRFRAGR